MRAALILGLWVLFASAVHADEGAPETRAFVKIVTGKERVFVGEPFELSLRIGVDRAWFDEHAVELFRKRMELPVQIEASGLVSLPDAVALDGSPTGGDVRLALGGREAYGMRRAGEVRDGRTFEVVECSWRYLSEKPVSHALDATLRFAYATRFEEDFLGGRIAVDRRDVVVRSTPLTLHVEPLPDDGRPDAFDGAVGRYTVSASLAAAPASPGAEPTLALTLVIEGPGNLAFVDPPAPERLVGFHVYGLVDDHRAPRRTIVYEITPLADTSRLPAVPFAFFDPGPPARYRLVHTEPIPLARPARSEASGDDPAPQAPSPWPWLLAAAGLVLAGLALQRLRRARALRMRRQGPSTTWSSRLGGQDADPAALLTDALAAHLDVAPAAVVGPQLAQRLVAAGVDAELAARTARALEGLVGARFGAVPADEGGCERDRVRAEIADLLTSLDAALGPPGS